MNAPAAPRLKITEIFRSLQGEGDAVGFPTVFIRLTGCPLRCRYCDTTYAFGGGDWEDELAAIDGELSIAFRPVINRYRGRSSVEIHLADWRLDSGPNGAS